ncbi:MAG: ComEC/Rec2 family competence protein [Pseudomonadota bacterium]
MRAGMLALAAALILMDWPGSEPAGAIDRWPDPVTVTGYVCEPASRTSAGRLAFVLCRNGDGASLPERIRMTLDASHSRHSVSGGLTIKVRLRPPRAPLNEGSGGFERWLWQERVGALATVSHMDHSPESCGLACRYHAARIALIHRLNAHLERLRHPELVEALLLGSRAGLRDEDWERLNATGTQHLVAISGLHVGLVATFAGLVLGAPITRMAHRRPTAGRWAAFILVCLAATGYALLAGFTVPTQRALVMVTVGAWVLTCGRQWRLWDAWLLALLAVVVIEPRAVWGPGFWLSFGAVACLILAMGARFQNPGGLSGLMTAQLAVVAGLAPLLLWHDMTPSGIAFLVNLVAIPWLSVVIMPVLLVAMPLVLLHPVSASWMAPGVDLAVAGLWSLLGWAEEGAFRLPVPSGSAAALGAGLVLCLLLPLGRYYRGLAISVLCLIPFAGDDQGAQAEGGVVMRIPDGVGGPVVLVRNGSRTLLFDAREPDARTRETTRDRVAPWLEARGIDAVDYLVLGHPQMARSEHWQSPALPPIRETAAAEECDSAGGTDTESIRVTGIRAGEGVCSLMVEARGRRAMLTGPLDRRGERRLLRNLDNPESIGLLLAPRGGVARSSQLGFIEALAPVVSIIAPPDWYSGEAGAPALARYEQAGGRRIFTPRSGEVSLIPEEGGWRVTQTRDCGHKARLC